MDENMKLDCDQNCEGCSGCDEIDDSIITLTDTETGEQFQFEFVDSFDYEDKEYAVLLTLDEDPEMVIAQLIEGEDGDFDILTLDDEEADPIYDYYDSLLDECFEEYDSEDEDKSEE